MSDLKNVNEKIAAGITEGYEKIEEGVVTGYKKTFTRQQLMDEFWDADTDTAPRAVDVYMTKLRSKLAHCEDFEIKTVHGLGYKVVIK